MQITRVDQFFVSVEGQIRCQHKCDCGNTDCPNNQLMKCESMAALIINDVIIESTVGLVMKPLDT